MHTGELASAIVSVAFGGPTRETTYIHGVRVAVSPLDYTMNLGGAVWGRTNTTSKYGFRSDFTRHAVHDFRPNNYSRNLCM